MWQWREETRLALLAPACAVFVYGAIVIGGFAPLSPFELGRRSGGDAAVVVDEREQHAAAPRAATVEKATLTRDDATVRVAERTRRSRGRPPALRAVAPVRSPAVPATETDAREAREPAAVEPPPRASTTPPPAPPQQPEPTHVPELPQPDVPQLAQLPQVPPLPAAPQLPETPALPRAPLP